ncbi:LacI family DNA-binding transcriptional regulator [Actinopolymorpha alba]|uniref:LacI family DNA-binding transcriptional regulator n=1 Tax=Actinopolymorpha alba TaxID=533267 RepID=UPI00037A99CA|nr:LacI family DNA-binding transcriptional regulator [Actinopolymorpha alba]
MSSITDVANKVGVSVATVSRALRGLPGVSEATRSAVCAAAAELGYVPSPSAAGLPTGRTGTIGVVAPWAGQWYFSNILAGAGQVLVEHGYDVLLYDLGGVEGADRRSINPHLLRKRVDALLALSLPLPSDEASALAEFRRPVTTIGPTMPGLSGVRIDEVGVGEKATRHLLDLGHRRIAFVGGNPRDHFGYPVAASRQEGYIRALQASDLPVDASLMFPATFTIDGGLSCFPALARHDDPPTAVVAASDEIAMGVMHAARAEHLDVPADLSVVGVDNHDMARLFNLTTVAQPVREQGRLAATLLIEQLLPHPPATPRVVTVPTTLVVRATTAPPSRQPGTASYDIERRV